MEKVSTATPRTSPASEGDSGTNTTPRSQRSAFVTMALTMTWQLAVVVLVPVVGGVQLDKALGTSSLWTFIGLGVALVASGVVMWRTMQVANRLPVPKLTSEQRAAIKKGYEEEDND